MHTVSAGRPCGHPRRPAFGEESTRVPRPVCPVLPPTQPPAFGPCTPARGSQQAARRTILGLAVNAQRRARDAQARGQAPGERVVRVPRLVRLHEAHAAEVRAVLKRQPLRGAPACARAARVAIGARRAQLGKMHGRRFMQTLPAPRGAGRRSVCVPAPQGAKCVPSYQPVPAGPGCGGVAWPRGCRAARGAAANQTPMRRARHLPAR